MTKSECDERSSFDTKQTGKGVKSEVNDEDSNQVDVA